MQLAASLLPLDALVAAVDGEFDRPRRLLPTDIAVRALTNHRSDVAQWMHARARGEFSPTSEETIPVSKASHGVRPVAVWDLPSRIFYRALTQRLLPFLPPLDRSRARWKAFQRGPLAYSGNYVVASDIAACYQYIDHELLAEELLVQSGDHEAVSAITALLAETGRRSYGLPQQSWSSDVLAEGFLDRLERTLVRRGLQVGRYNDDFRFTCESWSDAVRAIEVFSEEARHLGLAMNDLKTITWKRETYEAHLDEADRLREDIAREAELDLTQMEIDWYDATIIETSPTPSEVDRLAAARVLERWSRIAGRSAISPHRRAEHRAIAELLPFALATLQAEAGTNATVLSHAMKLLRYERTMTPGVAGYIAGRGDTNMVVASFDRLLTAKGYLNGWQTWWLQESLARLPEFASGAGAGRRLSWAGNALASAERTPTLRAYSALTLARHKLIDVDQLLGMYDRSSVAVRPILVAAIAILRPSKDFRRSVTSDNSLYEMIYEWALTNA